jgi:hypothetical protein
MSTLVKETSRVFQIRLPEQLAQQVEAVARDQKTDVNELMQWAIRVYLRRLATVQEELNEPIDPANPDSMTMAQVNEIVRESRRELERKRA